MVAEQLQFCLVLVTMPSMEEAGAIAQTLVREHLAACVNLLPVQSIYTWDGTVQNDAEIQMLIKTTTQRWPDLVARVKSLHPYDVPELIRLPIEQGLPDYLAWIAAST